MAKDIQSEVLDELSDYLHGSGYASGNVADLVRHYLQEKNAVIVPRGVSELPNKWRIFDGPTPSNGPLYTSGYMDAVKDCTESLDAMLAAQESES